MISKCNKSPEVGTERILHKFLLFPKKLPFRDKEELCQTKWLTKVAILQKYRIIHYYDWHDKKYFKDMCWAEKFSP
jgi:hypothetical protein